MYLRILIPLSTSTYSFTFLNTSPILSLPTSLYCGIYSFIHPLISSSLFLSSIYFQSSSLFTFSFSSFINLFVSSFAPLHCRCYMHTISTPSRHLSCSVLTHIALMGDLGALAADCCLLGGDALLTGGAKFRCNLLPVFKVFIIPIYIIISWRYSPAWALASATICLQVSRSLALSLHSFIPIFLRSMDTSPSHLILGLPLRLVAYSFPYSIFLIPIYIHTEIRDRFASSRTAIRKIRSGKDFTNSTKNGPPGEANSSSADQETSCS